jgi:hypothetical protein
LLYFFLPGFLDGQQIIMKEETALRKILEGTASHTGNEFFRALVKSLAEALHTKGAWVTEFLPGKNRLRALAFWMEDHFVDNMNMIFPELPAKMWLRNNACSTFPTM